MWANKEKEKEYYQRYREKHNAHQKEYYQRHKEKMSIINKNYYNNHKKEIIKRHREYFLKSLYGLSITEFNNLLLTQNNRCAICKEPLDLQNPHSVVIDHDHLTGKIRGILCNKCNLAIGLLRDNPEYTKRATEYLERNNNEK